MSDTESFAMLMSVESPKSRSTSATRLEKDCSHLSISLDDAITSLQFDETLLFAGFRLLIAIAISAFVCILIGSKKPTQQLFDQQRTVTNALAPRTDNQFLDIDNVDSLFGWLTSTLIPSISSSTQGNETLRLGTRRGYLDFSNQILGGLILETTVNKFRSCKSSEAFVNLHPYCVAEEKSQTSPRLNMSITEALATVTELKNKDSWANDHTSLFRVTIATYNSEIDIFSVTRLDVNFRDEGRTDPTVLTETVPDHREQPMTRSVVIIGIGLQLVGKVWSSTSNSAQFLCFFVLSYFVLKTNIDEELEELVASYAKSSDEGLRALQEVIEALDVATIWVNLLSVVGALTIIQMGFFTIRQLRFHPSGSFFSTFSTASNSVVSCANMLFQTFDYGSIETFHGSGAFYWTFMFVVNITLLNMMLAIVMRVYETITQDGYDGEISQLLLTRIRDNYPYPDALQSVILTF
ncbi:hypothetical protein P3T76_003952 [Phytophthora citrophthora]|uniref:Polycystin cation channel PKD1/PKD2 domain-containing protein n=1 Tax=Phytophthora citrophthora TaxID=4793 RepID=A0AAD9GT25_9STRA|nr:hypothetical protein P3T76_003952 [Phytophthora citrophthora]